MHIKRCWTKATSHGQFPWSNVFLSVVSRAISPACCTSQVMDPKRLFWIVSLLRSPSLDNNLDSPGHVYIRNRDLPWVRNLLEKGIQATCTKGHRLGTGRKKQIQRVQTYIAPKRGYLFTSRTGCHGTFLKLMNRLHQKHVVWWSGLSARDLLSNTWTTTPSTQQWRNGPLPSWRSSKSKARLRPHSGRAALITELMGQGLGKVGGMTQKDAEGQTHK